MIFSTKTSFVQNNYVITRYDPIADEWTQRASLNKNCGGFGCTVFNRMLYVVGGCVDFLHPQVSSSSVDRYDPLSNQWTSVTPMLTSRRGPGI